MTFSKYLGRAGKISAAFVGSFAVFAAVKEDKLSLAIKPNKADLGAVINQCKRQVSLYREETGIPGISIAVEVNGNLVWSDGVGYADVENHTPSNGCTVMRIASISKPITMALVGRLWQEGVLDIEKPISFYVPEYSPKTINNKQVSPTLKQLASHLGGVRHYRPVEEQRKADSEHGSHHTGDGGFKEFYSKTRFNNVREALNLFKDDELVYFPGDKFLYTTYGYSLLGAAAEVAAGKSLPILFRQLFRHLGLSHTHLDDPFLVIPCRARQYVRTKDGRLENAPYVDNSNKWAGGGLLSSAEDISRFGSLMLLNYQCQTCSNEVCQNAYLNSSIMKAIWTPVDRTQCWNKNGRYALGWCVLEPPSKSHSSATHPLLNDRRPIFTHSGEAVGGTTIMLIIPGKPSQTKKGAEHEKMEQVVEPIPKGVSVAILTNLQGVRGIGDLALDVALRFDKANL